MNAALVAQLLITFGPKAWDVIEKLIAVWDKQTLSPDEVKSICDVAKTTYDDYIKNA